MNERHVRRKALREDHAQTGNPIHPVEVHPAGRGAVDLPVVHPDRARNRIEDGFRHVVDVRQGAAALIVSDGDLDFRVDRSGRPLCLCGCPNIVYPRLLARLVAALRAGGYSEDNELDGQTVRVRGHRSNDLRVTGRRHPAWLLPGRLNDLRGHRDAGRRDRFGAWSGLRKPRCGTTASAYRLDAGASQARQPRARRSRRGGKPTRRIDDAPCRSATHCDRRRHESYADRCRPSPIRARSVALAGVAMQAEREPVTMAELSGDRQRRQR